MAGWALATWLAAPAAWGSDRLDADLTACLAAASAKPASVAAACTRQAAEAWNARLNTVYAALMKSLDSASRGRLLTAQRRWLDYRKSDADFAGGAWRADAGTVFDAAIAANRVEELRARVRALETYQLAE